MRFGSIARYDGISGTGRRRDEGGPTPAHVYASAGSYSATVTETDSAGTSTSRVFTGQTVSQNGGPGAQASRSVVVAAAGAAQPVVSVSASNLDFGTIAVGHRSDLQTVRITNSGDAPLGIASASLGGSDALVFSVTSDGCAGHVVAPGASCTAQVTFAPATSGPRSATLAFSDNASGSPHTFRLTGVGTFRVALSGHVTFNGGGVSGASVQACPSRGATPATCASTTSGAGGTYSVTVTAPPGSSYLMSASAPAGVAAGQRELPPITIPSGDFSGLDFSLPALPALATGLTVLSPSFGAETSATTNPVVFWNDPTTLELSRSLFPAGGTIVVTGVVLTGTNVVTGATASRTINVGGTVAGLAVGQTVGATPVSVTIPPLDPIHGPVSTRIYYQYSPDGSVAPAGLSATQILSEVYPQPTGSVAVQPTDPLPAYFVNVGIPGQVPVGGATISGQDADAFKVVPLTSYGVPAGTRDCASTPALLSQFDQTVSTPPPSTACGIAVAFTPSATPPKIYYSARLDVAVKLNGSLTSIHVTLLGCDETVATEASNVTGYDACG